MSGVLYEAQASGMVLFLFFSLSFSALDEWMESCLERNEQLLSFLIKVVGPLFLVLRVW